MKRVRYIWLLVLLWICGSQSACWCAEEQQTTLVGEIYDSDSGNPLANVNIVLSGTRYGTSTNDEGVFFLRAPLSHKTTMVVSCVGYKTQRFSIEPGISAGIDIAMEEKTTQLGDLFVVPGTNPAHDLMAKVRLHRPENDIAADTSLMNRETAVFVSEIRAAQLRRHFWKQMASGMLEGDDSTMLVPLYHATKEGTRYEIQAAGLTETWYETLLTELQKPIDFYHNLVPLYGSSFISPLAGDGNNYYNFYIVDSLRLGADSAKAYVLHFRTKAPFYYTFNGEMWIDSATYALCKMDVEVPAMVGANYLRTVTIHQQFFPSLSESGKHWILKHEQKDMVLDISSKLDTTHRFPTIYLQNTVSLPSSFLPATGSSESSVGGLAVASPTLNISSEAVDSAMQIINNMPLMRTARFLAYSIQTGYIPTGSCIEIGNVSEIFKITPQELVRLGLPLRTNEKLWKNVSLEAYAAYGFGDHAWKGAGEIHLRLPSPRRNIFHFRYADEYVYSDVDYFYRMKRENAAWFRYMGLTTAFLRSFYHVDKTYNTAVRKREFLFSSENDWTDNLESTFRLAVGRMGYGEPTHDYKAQPSFRYASLSATMRLGWNEKKVDLYFRRIHVYSNLPVLYLNGEIGSYQLDNQETYSMYGKLRLMLRRQVQLGVMGQLDYLVDGGFIFGAVPYPLLTIFSATESYAYDNYRFSLMHNYRYAADQYFQMTLDWNGKGCLFNLIPGIRYLHLRELFTFKMAVGSLSSRHNDVLPSPLLNPNNSSVLITPNMKRILKPNVPFIELGCGIGNILRVGEIYAIWRITHRDDPVAPLWAIRFRFRLTQ